jgi:hypothetical protein
MKDFALEMNFDLDSEVATIFEKYEDGKFQPPRDMMTFGPWLTKVAMDCGSFFSTVISENSLLSEQSP